MNNITQKQHSLRKAIAQAIVQVSKQETINAVQQKTVPKGDVFEFARAAGLLAIKKTSDIIPDCHPLPVEYAAISFDIEELAILISVEVHTVYKTGVEVEAMHGASATALVIYDMLKPIDKSVEISHIRLQEKKGGKSDFADRPLKPLKAAVIVCSDSIAAGDKQDFAGKAVIERLQQHQVNPSVYTIIPDEAALISDTAQQLAADGFDLVLFTGGTGLSPRDVTPEAIKPLLDREIPGIMEAARSYGQARTPYSMLSRGIAGFMGETLLLTLPGSTKGAIETMDALFPSLLHIFKVAEGMKHE